jgi:hypothetical protein
MNFSSTEEAVSLNVEIMSTFKILMLFFLFLTVSK